jgi:hypothetical protein
MAEQDALLLGRSSFEELRSYWPNQTDDTTRSFYALVGCFDRLHLAPAC